MAGLEGEIILKKGGEGSGKKEEETTAPGEERLLLSTEQEDEARSENVPIREKAHFYTSLSEYPQGVSFDAQDSDEEIILLLRRSFIINIPWMVFVALLAIIPLLLPFLPIPFFFESISTLTYVILAVFYYLVLFGFSLVNFSLWYFHVGLVTNKRVIDVDLHGILSRHVAETRLSLVQDVSYKQVGFVRSLFHFGDVFVQTAGSQQNVEFDRVPRPMFVAQVIGDLLGKPYHEADSNGTN